MVSAKTQVIVVCLSANVDFRMDKLDITEQLDMFVASDRRNRNLWTT